MSTYGLCFSTEIGINPIPLRNVIIGANIVDMIAEVTIRQTYKNVERDTIEAFYKFPIYEAAAICEFEAEIDGRRKIKGIVKESKEAAKEYTEAVQKGHGAYLLESDKEIDQPRAFVEYNPETETNCVMLTLVPKFSLNVIMSELVFIVDRSGSMDIEPCKTITLKATSHDDRPMVLDIPLDPVTLQGSKIHRLAARKLIQDLDDKKSFIHKHPKNVGKFIPASFVKEHIVKLGKTYNLASKFTSFIAIDERNNEISEVLIKSRTIPQKRNVPQLASQFSTLQSNIELCSMVDVSLNVRGGGFNIMDLVRSGIRSLVPAKSEPKETKEAQSVSRLYSECSLESSESSRSGLYRRKKIGLNIESEFNHKESQIGGVFDDK
ncbi:unnamed protein product [Rhizophagus irregularis]|nr:unnamed protein product [Rhizophagus irregularis]